jgi:hypothetical protein
MLAQGASTVFAQTVEEECREQIARQGQKANQGQDERATESIAQADEEAQDDCGWERC